MKGVTCCKGCVPPKRHREPIDCHMTCQQYISEKADYEMRKEKVRNERMAEGLVTAYFKEACGKRKYGKERRHAK